MKNSSFDFELKDIEKKEAKNKQFETIPKSGEIVPPKVNIVVKFLVPVSSKSTWCLLKNVSLINTSGNFPDYSFSVEIGKDDNGNEIAKSITFDTQNL